MGRRFQLVIGMGCGAFLPWRLQDRGANPAGSGSTNGSLFGRSINSEVFQHYTSKTGFVSSVTEFLPGPDGTIPTHVEQSHFTLSAVPEPQSHWMVLAGLGLVAAVRGRASFSSHRRVVRASPSRML